jgi:hypothetical protein
MKTENQPEPPWVGLADSIMNSLLYLLVFAGIVALPAWLVSFAYFKFLGSNLSPWISVCCIGIPIGIKLFKIFLEKFSIKKKIDPGMVQFMRCTIPGIESDIKLGVGTHIVLPWYEDWKKAWNYDEKWTIPIEKYRVSAQGNDLFTTAVATVRPYHDRLLPLHLLGNDNDVSQNERKQNVVHNMAAVLRKALEHTVAGMMEESSQQGAVQNQNGQNHYDSFEDVIREVGRVEAATVAYLETQDIVTKHGVVFDTFTIDDISSPDAMEKRRDAANAMRFMTEEARRTAEQNPSDELTPEKLLEATLLVSGDTTRAITTKVTKVDEGTIAGIGAAVESLAITLANALKPQSPVTGPSTPPPAIQTIVINGLNGTTTGTGTP